MLQYKQVKVTMRDTPDTNKTHLIVLTSKVYGVGQDDTHKHLVTHTTFTPP